MRNYRWVFKDSVGSRSRDMPLSELLGVLGSAEKEKREFNAAVDLHAKPSRGRLGCYWVRSTGRGQRGALLGLGILYAV